jgi:serine protease AprX
MLRLLPLHFFLFCQLTVFSQLPQWQDKVDSSLFNRFQTEGEAEFLIIMQQQADVRPSEQFKRKEDKGKFVYETLAALANNTQTRVREILTHENVPAQSFWVVNALWAKSSLNLIETIANLPEVARIEDNPVIHRQKLPESVAGEVEERLTPISWGLTQINANDVWALGYTGTGVVVGGQDTGYEWNHAAIKSKYRGWNGVSSDHNYNWHDAIHALINGGTNSCGVDLVAPCDDDNHGTHTMGTMAGGPNTDSIIGVAPGAKWIGCRNMEEGDGTPSTYIECFQWFIAPTNLLGSLPNSAMAPHVINNSWGCPTSEGCTSGNFATMETAVINVRAAGILVVVSAGNDGSACSTVSTPAAIYSSSFTVGATNSSDNIASFSSRGPVINYGASHTKPDVSAPGVNITSCVGNSNASSSYGYNGTYSGTSMAGPHVAGAAALIMSARPDLKGNVVTLENLLKTTAVPRYATAPFCGGDIGTTLPNNVYGAGRIDVQAAVLAALALPVELFYFRAEGGPNVVHLLWGTQNEMDCANFEIERSRDGSDWLSIGQQSCLSASLAERHYTFPDKDPLQGTSYYRLKQIDRNGLFSFSPVVIFHGTADHILLQITPVRASGSIFSDISGVEILPQWSVDIYTIDGRLITHSSALQQGNIALPTLTPGVYLAQLRDENGRVLSQDRFVW